jgi:hypothetical protein
MNVAEAAAAVLAREGVGVLLAYPLNPVSSRLTQASGCVFCMQAGPGMENSFGAASDSQ